KIPRWPFDKFPEGDRRLTTQMKSTGEVMAIERSFEAAMLKAIRSLEQARPDPATLGSPVLIDAANDRRLFAILEALRRGVPAAELAARSGYMPWFVERLATIVAAEERLRGEGLALDALAAAKRRGWCRRTSASTPVRGSSRRRRRTTTRPSRRRTRDRRGCRATVTARRRWWCWARGRSASARASSSTTAASRRRWRCAAAGSR